MFPIRDTYPTRNFPLINWLIIVINVAVFLYEIRLNQDQLQALANTYGFVPLRFVHHLAIGQFETMFTAMFMHGSWGHLIGNMWVLVIFGDNVEDRMGHARYLVFYLLMGVIACLTEVFFNLDPTLPSVGASGAIAGVLGAYFVLFPNARVVTYIPVFIFPWFVEISAWFYLAFWFFLQFITGVGHSAEDAGVAWWAHVGGFIAGIVLVRFFTHKRDLEEFYVEESYNPSLLD
jgi:membrane associated rhomboid family serine protease